LQVNRHAYDGVELLAGKQSIISKGEVPEAEGRQIPLEIKVAGEFEPEYRTPVDVQVRSWSGSRSRSRLCSILFLKKGRAGAIFMVYRHAEAAPSVVKTKILGSFGVEYRTYHPFKLS
jgi:hypothetical protein